MNGVVQGKSCSGTGGLLLLPLFVEKSLDGGFIAGCWEIIV